MEFNAKQVKDQVVQWIRDWFEENGKGCNAVIGISGGIAAYKTMPLIRLFRKSGYEVRVTATRNALRFVTPLTIETLSQNRLYTDMFDPNRTMEVEAESVSYSVSQYYGIETGENSFGYIASWSAGKELKELKASLETINRTAGRLINDIDKNIFFTMI